MSRKHYILIAQALRTEYADADNMEVRHAINRIVLKLCIQFKADNRRFDTERFITAILG